MASVRVHACCMADYPSIHCAHLTRPCIAGARKLLGRLAEATGVNATVLRRSDPALMQGLDCLATSVHNGVAASRGYWEELRAVLAAQHASRPAHVRVVCCSQCLHHAGRKLLVQAWQTRACDPSVGPNRAGMLLDVVSCKRRDGITAAVTHAPRSATMLQLVAAESRTDFDNNAG